ncbi:MAG: ATP synthase subunit I [Clostridia bacterium]|nr:ATP synthase subunit I [Clostridia bacterium]
MKKIDPTVWKETGYIAVWMLIFSVLMQAVFLIIGKWDYTVLLGNVLGAAASVLNFFLMGLTVQNALQKEEKDAKNAMKLSQTYRTLLLLVAAILGAVLPCFNLWSVVIPLLFPRIAIAFRPLFDRKQG